MPLTYSGVVHAVIVLVSETPRWFREEEIEFAYTMANQASAGLSALEMRSRLAEQADRQSALARAASALNARLDRRAVLDTLCREATVALGADISGVYLGDAQRGRRGRGRQRDRGRLRLVGIPDRPGRGRGRPGAEHRRARDHERLPGRR